jgi:hypothetical protein
MKNEAAKIGAISQGLFYFGPQTQDGLARRNWTSGCRAQSGPLEAYARRFGEISEVTGRFSPPRPRASLNCTMREIR